MLPNGAIIDVTHYSDDLAKDFWQQLLNAKKGLQTTVTLTAGAGVKHTPLQWTMSVTYNVNVAGMDKAKLAQVGAAIWWDFQLRFEKWEGTLGLGPWYSTFRNEDIPTTYLAYAAAARSDGTWTMDDVIGKFSPGGVAHPSDEAPDPNSSCIYTGICGSDTSRNTTIYLKTQHANGSWSYLVYPDELNIVPLIDPQYYSFSSCVVTGGYC